MKILYAIQGTGNGHLSRARDIIPILQKKGKLDLMVSGTQADVCLPYPITHTCKGLSFVFGKKGGVDLMETYKRTDTKQFYRDIQSFPLEQYDLVINDFEPVSAWAALLKKMPCISLSHQSAILSKKSPKPRKVDPLGKMILRNYAPAPERYGFHFDRFDDNIFTPVIREEIRQADVQTNAHFTVYLPSFDDKKIVNRLKLLKDLEWHVFSKHTKNKYFIKNIRVQPIDNDAFIKSMASSTGILCGAGFETPAEALFLNKKLMVIPMKNQYEQHCNAAALKKLGIPVIKNLKKKQIPKIAEWAQSGQNLLVDYPNITEEIIDLLLEKHLNQPRN